MGDPHDDVDYGPMVSLSARAEVHKMVKSSIKMGAKLNSWRKYQILMELIIQSLFFQKFSLECLHLMKRFLVPVFSIIEANDNDHAIDLANDSKYGLGAAVFTSDINKGKKIAEEKIQAGFVLLMIMLNQTLDCLLVE